MSGHVCVFGVSICICLCDLPISLWHLYNHNSTKLGVKLSAVIFIGNIARCYFLAGHEILPCADEHMKAICQPCSDGYVQPANISSFDNITTTKCFKPQGTCQAHGRYFKMF